MPRNSGPHFRWTITPDHGIHFHRSTTQRDGESERKRVLPRSMLACFYLNDTRQRDLESAAPPSAGPQPSHTSRLDRARMFSGPASWRGCVSSLFWSWLPRGDGCQNIGLEREEEASKKSRDDRQERGPADPAGHPATLLGRVEDPHRQPAGPRGRAEVFSGTAFVAE